MFSEKFTTPCKLSLDDFLDIIFKAGENISERYQKKIHVGWALGFYSKLLIEGLTNGLPKVLEK